MKHQNDSDLNDPIQGATEVRQAYDALPSEAVPAELDARILARARAAVSKPSKVVEFKQPAVRRWAMPITIAASVVVVMSVVYESRLSEKQFSTPPTSPVAVTSSVEQSARTFIEEDREPAPASAPEIAEQKLAAPRSKPMADAADVAPAPPPPAASPPALAMMGEAMAPALAAPVISPPMPKESAALANELRQESSGQDSKEQERARTAVTAQSQLLGKVAKQADSKSSLAALDQLAGHYSYQSYSVTLPSGQVLGLQELGATDASLDIDAQGVLTLRMHMSNGKTIIQTAKVLEVKLDDSNGYWVAQWPDMSYPVKGNIVIEGDKLVSTTWFEERADSARYGSVEQATLRRVAR